MFSYTLKKDSEEVFDEKCYPKISRLFHNYNNPGWTYNYHLHKNDTEIVFIAGGKATYTVNMESFTLQKGQLLIIEKGALHSISSDKDNPVDAWTCLINDYKIKDFSAENKLLNHNTYSIIDTGIHENFIKTLMEEISLICLSNSPYTSYTCSLLAASLTSVIHNLLPNEERFSENKKSSFVKDILIYISEHYNEQITLKKLSEIFHISAGHISHSFSNEYGVSPINYAIDLRMCEAKLLLLNTKESLTSISQKVGYDNTTHFSNIFTKRNNCSPLEFRSKHLNKQYYTQSDGIHMNDSSENCVDSNVDEVLDLKKNLDKLREENEILQKAMSILASKK